MEASKSQLSPQAAGNAATVSSENNSSSSAVISGSIESIATTSSTTLATTATTGTVSAAADSSDGEKPLGSQSTLTLAEQPRLQQHSVQSRAQLNSLNPMHSRLFAPSPLAHQNQMHQQHETQQLHLQQQQHLQHPGYPPYLNRYDPFYQDHHHSQFSHSGTPVGYGNTTTSNLYCSESSGMLFDYKRARLDCRSGINNHDDGRSPHAPATITTAGDGSASVSTTTVMSPRVVNSNSPTSTSSNLQASALIGGANGGGNPESPIERCHLKCKKCSIIFSKESELLDHISNIHGASPYGSSGYSSSPYIKEEQLPAQMQQQQQQCGGSSTDEILDLDSQKMIYSTQHMQPMLQQPNDPLHSMHNMQQRNMPVWNQPQSLPENSVYLQQQQQQQSHEIIAHKLQEQPNQSQYHANIKQEYSLIKTEYPDSQNYVNKSFDPTAVGGELCSQSQQPTQQQMMPLSPAEFPSTTTGSQDQQQQQQFRGFEPPTSSSVLPATGITPKAANWKSNEARRPKTYNCTACNKWFTSSGHLKRHYNTTLHKNAVKSSGKPDPANYPISTHHHPHHDPNTKHSRRNSAKNSSSANAAAVSVAPAQQQQQQQTPVPLQSAEPPRSPLEFNQGAGMGQMSQYSASPSPLQQQQQANGIPYLQAQNGGYSQEYMQQVQSTSNTSPQHISAASTTITSNTTVLNGHPNGLAGPSAQLITSQTPSSQTRGLLNSTSPPTTTTTIIIKNELMEDHQQHRQQQLQKVDEKMQIYPDMTMKAMPERLELDRMQLHSQQTLHYSQLQPESIQLSPNTTCNQLYQDHQLQIPQTAGNTFLHTTLPPPPQQHQIPTHNITEQQQQQPFNNPLDTSKPQQQQQLNNNMPLLQQHIITTPNTVITNMDKIHMERNQHHQLLVGQGQEYQIPCNSLVHNTNIRQPTINFTPHTPTTQLPLQQQHITQSYQQLEQEQLCPQQQSGQVPQGRTYLTTTGSSRDSSKNEPAASYTQYNEVSAKNVESFGFSHAVTTAPQQQYIAAAAVHHHHTQLLPPLMPPELSGNEHLPTAATNPQFNYASTTNLTSDQNSLSSPIAYTEYSHIDSDSSGFVDTPEEIKSEDSARSTEKIRPKRSTRKLKPLQSISCENLTTLLLNHECDNCGKQYSTNDILDKNQKSTKDEGNQYKNAHYVAHKSDQERHIHYEHIKKHNACPTCDKDKHFSRNDHVVEDHIRKSKICKSNSS